jgi:hypothetical protein
MKKHSGVKVKLGEMTEEERQKLPTVSGRNIMTTMERVVASRL